MRFRIFLVILGFCVQVSAYDGKLLSLSVGGKLSNDLVRRGARYYDGVQVTPVVYLGFFDHRVQFLFNSLEFTDFLYSDTLRGRTKINTVSDRPLLKTSGPLTVRNSRESSWEWTTRLEFFPTGFLENWGQLDLAYAKDLKAHGGHYLELTGRVTLARLSIEGERPKYQPQLFVTTGWGDSKHNAYQYGASPAKSGLNHVAYGFYLVSPSRIDPHYPVVQLYRYDVIGSENRAGSLVKQTSGYHLDITIAFGVL